MRIPGKRIRRTRLIQTEKYVVAVEVEMVVPVDDPSEPCYESETVQLLREIKEHAERGVLAGPEGQSLRRRGGCVRNRRSPPKEETGTFQSILAIPARRTPRW